jgi:hypothetical protein
MTSRFQRFKNEFGEVDWGKYFNLDPKITIKHTIEENSIDFTIKYLRVDKCPRLLLPIELIRYVQSYLVEHIELYIRSVYTRDYPFVAPIWTLLDVRHTLGPLLKSWHGEMTLYHYYLNKINEHNQYYTIDWSPAISISNDLLDFIRRVNHFEDLFTCLTF